MSSSLERADTESFNTTAIGSLYFVKQGDIIFDLYTKCGASQSGNPSLYLSSFSAPFQLGNDCCF